MSIIDATDTNFELERVELWRLDTLERAGYDPEAAAVIAASPEVDLEEPTCETIISPTTVEDFESLGWTSLSDKFLVGSFEIPDGVQCIWGDFSTATDHVQLFGWAPIAADQAEKAEAELVGQGWRREESPEGVYITESPETAVSVDEDGYGLTYLFGDGWVKYADTKPENAAVPIWLSAA